MLREVFGKVYRGQGMAMSKRFLLFSLTVALLSLSAFFLVRVAQSTNSPLAKAFVKASNIVFTPDAVTINVGDTVQWDNVGGLHNVVTDDRSFTSGSPSTSEWTLIVTFDTPGTYPYYCEIHVDFGMSGVITVIVPPVLDEILFLPTVLKN